MGTDPRLKTTVNVNIIKIQLWTKFQSTSQENDWQGNRYRQDIQKNV